MKRNLTTLTILGMFFALTFPLNRPAHAAPLAYSGSLELRSPVWASPRASFEPSFKHLDVAGHLRLAGQGSPLALWVAGEQSLSRGYFVHESELKVGLDFLAGGARATAPLVLFSYWERRFNLDVDRVFVGARLGFHGVVN
jgi:hypothetical protein